MGTAEDRVLELLSAILAHVDEVSRSLEMAPEEVVTALFSLEARVPLLDHEVLEKAACLNEKRRFRPLLRKQVLRDGSQHPLPL